MHASSRSLVTMELFEVQYNEPVSPGAFHYNPGDLQITDQTEDAVGLVKQQMGIRKQRSARALSP